MKLNKEGIEQRIIERIRTTADNGTVLPFCPEGDAVATHLRFLLDEQERLDKQISLAKVAICGLIGSAAAIETVEGTISFKMSSVGQVDWRAVAIGLGAENYPEAIEGSRKPPVRSLRLPDAWRKGR